MATSELGRSDFCTEEFNNKKKFIGQIQGKKKEKLFGSFLRLKFSKHFGYRYQYPSIPNVTSFSFFHTVKQINPLVYYSPLLKFDVNANSLS